MWARKIIWMATLLQAGCAMFGAASADRDGGFAEYLQRVLLMDATQVQAQVDELGRRPSPAARLRLAMLLAAPAFPLRDGARAVAEATAVARSDRAPEATRDAAADLRRIEDLDARLREAERRAQEAERKLEAADPKRFEQLEHRLRDAEKRAADAERKLEALKQIDREMTDRPSGNGARP